MSNTFNNANFLIEPAFADKKAYALVFAPDNSYTPYFGVALQSLICNSRSDELYDIVVFEEDISERNKKLLFAMIPENFSLRFFHIDDFIKNKLNGFTLHSMKYWSVSMYYRLFIPFVMQKYERVMYADSDVCFNKPIKEFYTADFEGKELIAVLDNISPIMEQAAPKRYKLYQKYGIEKPEGYFNSGILLLNLKNIALPAYTEALQHALKQPGLMFPDQDVANIVFYNKVKPAPLCQNCQYAILFNTDDKMALYPETFKREHFEAMENPSIIHYTSSTKPWNSPKEQDAELFWKYARLTPFYEEILFTNISNTFKKLLNRKQTLFHYYRCKILSHLTFGQVKKRYKTEKSRYKAQLKEIKAILKR